MRHCTSIEQSKKLLNLGLKAESADMKFKYDHNEHRCIEIPMMVVVPNWDDEYNKDIPCWSVGALLEVMPLPSLIKDEFPLSLQKENTEVFGWECICYDKYGNAICEQWSNTKVDACYNMICWLLENNYIKKEE